MCKEYINLQTGEKLDLNILSELVDNSALKFNPKIWVEWDFEKNTKLGIDIFKITKSSSKKVNWICLKCNSEYVSLTYNKVASNKKCGYCSGKKVNHTNSLIVKYPEIAKEWSNERNLNLTPNDVTSNSNKKVWWKCKLNHEWEVSIDKRTAGSNCPYCQSCRVLVGFNDMWTTRPDLAELLLHSEDGYKYTKRSNRMLSWKCSKCKSVINNRRINDIYKQGLSCPTCSDNVSFGEKVMFQLLLNLNVNFKYDNKINFSKKSRYDFILPDYKLIIETHGLQHYQDTGFSKLNGKSLADEINNDLTKEKLAIDNGYKYISVNTSKNDLILLKNEILNSELATMLNITEESFIGITLNYTLVLECWKLYYENNLSESEIANKLKIGKRRVTKYIKLKNQVNEINNIN